MKNEKADSMMIYSISGRREWEKKMDFNTIDIVEYSLSPSFGIEGKI